MGLQSFRLFQLLRKAGHETHSMGFKAHATGKVNHLNARMHLAKGFQHIALEGYSASTSKAYTALFRVFLAHSAMECFMDVFDITGWNSLDPVLAPYDPEVVIQLFREQDKHDKLFTFLNKHLQRKSLRDALQACKDGRSANVAILSASIRHIFVHGHLTAHANQIASRATHQIGFAVSDFVLRMIDAEFTKTVTLYCDTVGFAANPDRA